MSAEKHSRKQAAEPTQEQNAWAYHRLPKLVYIPVIWGEEDRSVWRDMGQTGTLSTSLAFDSACQRRQAGCSLYL